MRAHSVTGSVRTATCKVSGSSGVWQALLHARCRSCRYPAATHHQSYQSFKALGFQDYCDHPLGCRIFPSGVRAVKGFLLCTFFFFFRGQKKRRRTRCPPPRRAAHPRRTWFIAFVGPLRYIGGGLQISCNTDLPFRQRKKQVITESNTRHQQVTFYSQLGLYLQAGAPEKGDLRTGFLLVVELLCFSSLPPMRIKQQRTRTWHLRACSCTRAQEFTSAHCGETFVSWFLPEKGNKSKVKEDSYG